MNILITGASGFIGQHLIERILKDDQENVVYALVRSPEKLANLFPERVVPIRCDLADETMNEDFVQALPEDLAGVIHTAGIVHSHHAQDFYQINTEGSARLIVALRGRFGHRSPFHFMLISSLSAAGPGTLEEVDESKEAHPVSDYGKSKLEAEQQLQKLSPPTWTTSIIRPPMVIGPKDPAMFDIFKMVSKGVYLVPGMKGDEQTYSFVAVYDLVEVILAAFKQSAGQGEIYYPAYPQIASFKELHQTIHRCLHQGKNRPLLKLPIPRSLLQQLGKGLSRLNHLFPGTPVQDIRLTEDKVKEIMAASWCCSPCKSQQKLGIHYEWNLERIVQVTFESYVKDGLLSASSGKKD